MDRFQSLIIFCLLFLISCTFTFRQAYGADLVVPSGETLEINGGNLIYNRLDIAGKLVLKGDTTLTITGINLPAGTPAARISGSSQGAIIWSSPAAEAGSDGPNGVGSGAAGTNGTPGQVGDHAPNLTLNITGDLSIGYFYIYLIGQGGARGGNAGHGAGGSWGSDMNTPGARGGDGGIGGVGGRGGNGGKILINVSGEIKSNDGEYGVLAVYVNGGNGALGGNGGYSGGGGYGYVALNPAETCTSGADPGFPGEGGWGGDGGKSGDIEIRAGSISIPSFLLEANGGSGGYGALKGGSTGIIGGGGYYDYEDGQGVEHRDNARNGNPVKAAAGARAGDGGNGGNIVLVSGCGESTNALSVSAKGGNGFEGGKAGDNATAVGPYRCPEEVDYFGLDGPRGGDGGNGGSGGSVRISARYITHLTMDLSGGKGGKGGQGGEQTCGGHYDAEAHVINGVCYAVGAGGQGGQGGKGGDSLIEADTINYSFNALGGTGGEGGPAKATVCPSVAGEVGLIGPVGEILTHVSHPLILLSSSHDAAPGTSIDLSVMARFDTASVNSSTVSLTIPEGTTLLSAAPGYTRNGSTITWSGTSVGSCRVVSYTAKVSVSSSADWPLVFNSEAVFDGETVNADDLIIELNPDYTSKGNLRALPGIFLLLLQ